MALLQTRDRLRIRAHQRRTIHTIQRQALIKARPSKALATKIMAQVADILVRSGKGIISSTTVLRITASLSNIISPRCNRTQHLPHCLRRIIILIMRRNKDSINPNRNMVLSNPLIFSRILNRLMVTVCHPTNMLPSSGLARSSMVPHSLIIAVVEVVVVSHLAVEVLKPH